MTILFCPKCNMRYVVGFDVTDVAHECKSGNPVIDQEDVVIMGDWEDFSGSGTRAAQEVMLAGAENLLQGTRTDLEGDTRHELTRRGQTSTTRRQRPHIEFVEVKHAKKD